MQRKLSIVCWLTYLILSLASGANGQVSQQPVGNINSLAKQAPLAVMNGNSVIATSYTMSACGLNYTESHITFAQRTISFGTLPSATVQPAEIVVSGIPANASILQAFLYVSLAGSGPSLSPVFVTPASAGSIVPMTIIGSNADSFSAYPAFWTYRADVTANITGNGTYTLSGLPTSTVFGGGDDAAGAALFVIYTDPAQAYLGNIIIADGCQTSSGFYSGSIISGFSVTGTPVFSKNFMMFSNNLGFPDLHANLNAVTNDQASINYTLSTPETFWDFIDAPGMPVAAGQSTAAYGLISSDQPSMLMAGMYYRLCASTCVSSQSVNLSVNTSSCTGSATVSVNNYPGPFSYLWSGSLQTGSSAEDLPAGVTTVSVEVTELCLSGTATVNISLPSPVIVNQATVCRDIGAVLSATANATGFSWSPANGLSSVSGVSVTASSSVTTVYTVTAVNASNCASSATTELNILPTPTAGIATSPTVCEGGTLVMTPLASLAYYFLWSGPGNFTTTSFATCVIDNFQLTQGGNYTLTAFHTNGCSASAVTTIAVIPAPLPVLSGNSPVCDNATLILTGSPGTATSWNWSGPAGTSTSQVFTIANPSISYGGIYNFNVGYANGCLRTSTIQIIIGATPQPTLATNSPVCDGGSLTLNVTPAFFQGFYSLTGPDSYSSFAVSNTISPVSLTAGGLYNLSATTTPIGCVGTASVLVSILGNPTVSATGTIVCSGPPAQLNASGSGGNSWSWSGPLGFSSVSANAVIGTNFTPGAAGIYTVTLLNAATGCSSTATASLGLLPQPAITSSNVTGCSGSPVTLSASGAVSYSWTGPNNFTSQQQTILISGNNNTVTQTYTVTGFSVDLCSASVPVLAIAIPGPVAFASGTTVCSGRPATLTATGGIAYLWAGPGGYSSSSAISQVSSVNGISAGIYTVYVTAANACTASATTSLIALPLPSVSATGNTVCGQTTGVLNAYGAAGYQWTGPGGFSATDFSIAVSSVNTGSFVYSVVGTAQNNCTATATTNFISASVPVLTLNVTNTLLCTGQSVTLTVSGAETYSWTNLTAFNSNTIAITPLYNATYSVIGTNQGVCSAQTDIDIFVDLCTGFQEVKNDGIDFRIFPNPVSETLWIDGHGSGAADVLNSLGQKFMTMDLKAGEEGRINVSELPEGMYYVTIPHAGGKKCVKFYKAGRDGK